MSDPLKIEKEMEDIPGRIDGLEHLRDVSVNANDRTGTRQ